VWGIAIVKIKVSLGYVSQIRTIDLLNIIERDVGDGT
jgi:hypothetical protein